MSKPHVMIPITQSPPPQKKKENLANTSKNPLKTEIEHFPQCAISHEN